MIKVPLLLLGIWLLVLRSVITAPPPSTDDKGSTDTNATDSNATVVTVNSNESHSSEDNSTNISGKPVLFVTPKSQDKATQPPPPPPPPVRARRQASTTASTTTLAPANNNVNCTAPAAANLASNSTSASS